MEQKIINRKNGFTLVELILSIAILGIISIAMLNAFGMSLFNIVRSGNRSINLDTAANDLLLNPVANSEEMTLIIKLGDDISDSVEIKGRMGVGTGSLPGQYANVDVEIESFIPGL